MVQFGKLTPDSLSALRDVNLMLLSCNVEMTEVAGGTSWAETTTVALPHRKCCEERGT